MRLGNLLNRSLKALCVGIASGMTLCGCAQSSGPEVVSNPVANEIAFITTPDARGWSLIWSDEFEAETLDRKKWTPEQSCWGGGNNERQCYVDDPDNIFVDKGYLILRAKEEAVSGTAFPEGHPDYPGSVIFQTYSSGKVRTRGLAAWTYGRFSARIRLPEGQGTWPAFWMMSDEEPYGPWPLSGEIDIMEAVNLGEECESCEGGIENRTINALHYGELPPKNEYQSTRTPLIETSDGFHEYAVEWGEGRIDWFVDGRRIFTLKADSWFTGSSEAPETEQAPFEHPFYIMLNLAVGGHLSEGANAEGVDPKTFPAEMQVDWVRVHQCMTEDSLTRGCMSPD